MIYGKIHVDCTTDPKTVSGRLTYSSLPIIALKGRAGSGKSTAAKYLTTKGYRVTSFAAPLKKMMKAFGLHDAELYGDRKESPSDLLCGRSPREAMQLLGTEWGRALHPELWTSHWRRLAETILRDGDLVVVDDCRFENEAAVVRALGGVVIEIDNPRNYAVAVDVDEDGGMSNIRSIPYPHGITGHASEAQDFDPDIIVVNDKTRGTAALHASLDEAISVLMQDAYDEAA